MKIAFVSNHPAPYRDDFLWCLVQREEFTTEVYSLVPNDNGHAFWKLKKPPYDNKIIGSHTDPAWKFCVRCLRLLFKGYDFICWPGIFGWYLKMPVLVSALLGLRYAITADTVEQIPLSWFKRKMKRFIVRRASLVFVPGRASMNYFMKEFGIDGKKIVTGAYSLDVIRLELEVMRLRRERAMIRKKLGICEGDIVFLQVANMIPTRHYPITVKGFLGFAQNKDNVKFVIVGKGPDLEKMKAVSIENSTVKVVPGCSFEEMLSLYAAADVYVHGGKEPASTALVIGAIAHLPILSSDAVGCSADVLEDRHTGIRVCDYLSSDEWRKGFGSIYKSKDLWHAWGDAANSLSRRYDAASCAQGFSQAVQQIIDE